MYLVTGGAGFIGSHLVDRLLKKEEKVIVLDNFNSFYPPSIKRKNIKAHLNNPHFTLIEADIRQRTALKDIFQSYRIDKVIHLAAQAGVRDSLINPFLYEDVNIRGTLNLLDVCKDYPLKSFIFASSSSIYGKSENLPFSEDEILPRPISPYGATKLSGEIICRTYHELYNIPIVCIRIFTAYGPRQRPEMAIHKFTHLIEEGKEVPLFGNGSSKRDYTYISDLVEGIIGILERDFKFEIFNLGGSHPIELTKIVTLIERSLSRKAKVRYLPSQPGEPSLTFANISKATQILNYKPKVGIEEGIEKFVSWYREK